MNKSCLNQLQSEKIKQSLFGNQINLFFRLCKEMAIYQARKSLISMDINLIQTITSLDNPLWIVVKHNLLYACISLDLSVCFDWLRAIRSVFSKILKMFLRSPFNKNTTNLTTVTTATFAVPFYLLVCLPLLYNALH